MIGDLRAGNGIARLAISPEWATLGMEFMQEMIQMVAQLEKQELGTLKGERVVQILSYPSFGFIHFTASPANFGSDLHNKQVNGEVRVGMPTRGCAPLTNVPSVKGRVTVLHRHDCMFQEKARHAQQAGAIAVIIVDNIVGSSAETSAPFAMSGDSSIEDDIKIPVVFLFHKEGIALLEHLHRYPGSVVRISDRLANPSHLIELFFKYHHFASPVPNPSLEYIEVRDDSDRLMVVDTSMPAVIFNFRFGNVHANSDASLKHNVVEENIARMERMYKLGSPTDTLLFYNVVRRVAYSLLGLNTTPAPVELAHFALQLPLLEAVGNPAAHDDVTVGAATRVACRVTDDGFRCFAA